MKPDHKMLKGMSDGELRDWLADLQGLLTRARMEERRRRRRKKEEAAAQARMRQPA